jgi:hypothetical protein
MTGGSQNAGFFLQTFYLSQDIFVKNVIAEYWGIFFQDNDAAATRRITFEDCMSLHSPYQTSEAPDGRFAWIFQGVSQVQLPERT